MDTPGKVFYFVLMLNRILVAAALIGSALGYTWWSRQSLNKTMQAPLRESLLQQLPGAEFTTLEGQPFSLTDVKTSGTKAILVHFWATWCGPCEAELPDLMSFIEKQPGNATFLIVAVNDEVPKIKKYLDYLKPPTGVKIHWLLDNTQIHRQAFGTTKLPESYLFAAHGTMLRKLVGPQEWGNPQFFDMMKPFSP